MLNVSVVTAILWQTIWAHNNHIQFIHEAAGPKGTNKWELMCSTAVASGCEMCETRCLPPTRSTHYTFIGTFILTVFALHYSNLQNRKCNQAQLDCSQSVWETHFSWDQVPDKAVLTWQFTSVLFSKHDRCSFLTFREFFLFFNWTMRLLKTY